MSRRVAFLLLIVGLLTAGERPHKGFIERLYKQAQEKHQAYDLLRELTSQYPHRLSGSPDAEGAVQWARKSMEALGFDKVYLQEVMVPHWVRGEAESCFMVDPRGRREKLSVLALGRSVATAEQGISAPLVVVDDVEDIKNMSAGDVKGKIVFYNAAFPDTFVQTMYGYRTAVMKRVAGASEAARKGAVAVVIRSVTTARDDYPHTGSLVYARDVPKIPAAALGYQSADRLYRAWQKEPDTRLFLKINSKTYTDKKSYNVIGEIRGSEHPEKIIVIGGHLDAWDVGEGAQDDGAGIVHSIMAAALLRQAGYKPRNTLRVVCFMNEENGLRGGKKYAETAAGEKQYHIAAIETDAGGFTPRGFGISGKGRQLETMKLWLKYFPPFTISEIRDGGGGADIGPLGKAMGTTLIGLIPDSQRYFDFHHSDRDLFEAVNRRELELGTASLSALLYLIDSLGL